MNRTETLAAIRTASETMKTAAEQGDWEVVAEQERLRLAMIESVFSDEQMSHEESELARDMINFIMDNDQDILAKAAEAKNLIHSQVKQLFKEKKAFEEYTKN